MKTIFYYFLFLFMINYAMGQDTAIVTDCRLEIRPYYYEITVPDSISILNHVEYGSGETGLSDLIKDFENSNKFIITDSLTRKKIWVKLMISEFGRVLDVKPMNNSELYFDNMELIDDFLFSLGNWTPAKGITDSGKTIFFTDEYVIVLFRE